MASPTLRSCRLVWCLAAICLISHPAPSAAQDAPPATETEPAPSVTQDTTETETATETPIESAAASAAPESEPAPEPASTAPATTAQTTSAPPAASSPAATAAPAVTVTGQPGQGLTVSAGDVFSMSMRARVQMRATVRVDDPNVDLGVEIRTARLWWTGHILDPNIRFGMQLALGANDFEPGNASPIFDAFLELRHLRDLNVRVGQFFVPFDRARTIREFALQTVDRAEVVRELTLDRDVGIVAQSTDFLGLGGALTYHLGVFGGDGRNRLGAAPDAGLLYVSRVSVRPFGGFDDDSEGDLARSPSPRLAIGAGFAFNHQTDRPRSTIGVPFERARFDYVHLAGDLVFKWAGVSLLAEIVWRESVNGDVVRWMDDEGQERAEWSRSGWGYLAQLGVMVHPMIELWGRWEHLIARAGTDPSLITQANARGHGVAAGLNVYVSGHQLKVQADWTHSFGDDFLTGVHIARVQLDASF